MIPQKVFNVIPLINVIQIQNEFFRSMEPYVNMPAYSFSRSAQKLLFEISALFSIERGRDGITCKPKVRPFVDNPLNHQ